MHLILISLLIIFTPTSTFACSLHDNNPNHDLPNLSSPQQSTRRTIPGEFKRIFGLNKESQSH